MRRNGGTGQDTLSVRRHNLRSVLRHLHLHGPTTRVELGRVTGLTRSAVGDLVTELTIRQLVTEGEVYASSGARGRPSLVVAPRQDTARVVAASILDDSLQAASIGLGGTVAETVEVPHEFVFGDPGPSVDQLASLLERQLAALDAAPLAVGITVPGLVRATDGVVALTPRLGWRDYPLGQELAGRLGLSVPVLVGNDSNFATLAEHVRGSGRGLDHVILLDAGLGVGGGIIVDNRLLLGGRPGYGGEVGHIVTDPGGRPCDCGGHGCWETQIGVDAVLARAGIRATGDHQRRAALTELFARADRHDADALAVLTALLPALGAGIATLVSLFTPERIILGGLFAAALRHDEAGLRAAVDHHRPAVHGSPIDLAPAQLGQQAPMLGAAEAAINAFLDGFPPPAVPGQEAVS